MGGGVRRARRSAAVVVMAVAALVASGPVLAAHTVELSCDPANCTVPTGQSITLHAKSDAKEPLGYQWDLDGDGEFESKSPQPQITHTYPKAGEYQARVSVAEGEHDATSDPVTVRVQDPPPKEEPPPSKDGTPQTPEGPAPPPSSEPSVTPVSPQDAAALPAGPTVRSDFDAIPEGTRIADAVHGVRFPDAPVAITPKSTLPRSFPRVAVAASCAPDRPAVRPANAPQQTVRMAFDVPASAVALHAGLLDGPGDEAGPWARLLGLDASGRPVADSGEIRLAGGTLDARLQLVDPGGRIAEALLTYGTRTASPSGGALCPAIDDLELRVPPELVVPPNITITHPAARSAFTRPDFRVRGQITAPQGIDAFCLTTERLSRPPENCAWHVSVRGLPGERVRPPAVTPDGRFDVAPPVLRRGHNAVTAWVRDRRGQTASATINVNITHLPTYYDLSVEGIEVSQGIQQFALPRLDRSSPPTPGIPRGYRIGQYRGVPLAEGGRTFVRVFAGARFPISTSLSGPGAGARLWGYRRDAIGRLHLLPGSPLLPDARGVTALAPALGVSDATRAGISGGHVFTLPPSWTSGIVRLVADVTGPTGFPEYREILTHDNHGGVDAVPFTPVRPYTVAPVRLVTTDPANTPPADPNPYFDGVRATMPLAENGLRLLPYQGTIDVTGTLRCNAADQAGGDCPFPHDRSFSYTAAVNRWDQQANAPGQVYGLGWNLNAGRAIGAYAMVDLNGNRPLTAVAHEMWHLFANPRHPGNCDTAVPEPWPPDERGYIQGIGLDRRPSRGGGVLRAVLAPSERKQYYDLLSYCANTDDSDAWISTRNWNRGLMQARAGGPVFPGIGDPPARAPRASRRVRATVAAGEKPALVVRAAVHDGAVQVLDVARGQAAAPTGRPSPYAIAVHAADGRELATAPAVLQEAERHGGHAHAGLLVARLAAGADAVRVAVLHHGQPVAARSASASAPRVAWRWPKGGPVIRRGSLRVAWNAGDPDGDTLQAMVSASTDGGRSWRTIHSGPAVKGAALPAGSIPAGRARLRVTVSDGFRETSATSPAFRSQGAPPTPVITGPGPKRHHSNLARLTLAGHAFDDAARPLRGRRLTWRVGRRVVGHGERLSMPALTPGRHRITLTATDRRGRSARRTTTVRVVAEVPQFTVLRAPAVISRTATRVTLRVAAAVPSVLRSGRRTHRIGRKVRRIAVPVARGRATAVVPLRLTAAGRTRVTSVHIDRR